MDKINRRALEEQKKIMQAKMKGQLKNKDNDEQWKATANIYSSLKGLPTQVCEMLTGWENGWKTTVSLINTLTNNMSCSYSQVFVGVISD